MPFEALWKRFFPTLNMIVRVSLSLAIVMFFILSEAGRIQVQFFKQLELLVYDARLKFTLPNTIDPRIVIVDIDEKSLVAEGRWPWSRDKVALLTQQLFDRYKVKVLGFDVIFSEPDTTSGLAMLEQLGKGELKEDAGFQAVLPQVRKDLNYDDRFAQVLRNYPVVLSFAGSSNLEASSLLKIGQLPPPAFTTGTFGKRQINAPILAGYSANLKVLQDNAASAGHILPDLDVDGIIRRVPMLVQYGDGYYESISLAMYRTYRNNAPIRAVFPSAEQDPTGTLGPNRIDVAQARIPIDGSTSALVPYRGPFPKFRYISATDILRGTLPANELSGSIALVGTSAQGLLDLRSTPVGTAFPGVEVHANMLSGFLDNRILEKSENDSQLGTAFMLVFGALISFLLPRLSAILATLLIGTVLGMAMGWNMYQWQYNGSVYGIALFLLMIIALYMFNMAYGFFVESRSKRAIVSRFGEYVPKELVSEMARNPADYSMKAESREMTVLFSDIRGFTTISEGLAPDQLSLLMNSYLTPMTEVVQKHRGTIDKYIGDAIMAFWGAPLPDADHVKHAVITALEMQRVLATMGPEFEKRGWPVLHIGVGVNCGKMSVGNMGSRFRRAYTVLGDAVNLAARLEGITKEYGVGIVVSENVVNAAPIAVYRELDRVRVKGKHEPISIYEPLGMIGEVLNLVIDETDRFHKALQHFRAQEWDEAEHHFFALLDTAPETKLYNVYLDRIRVYRTNPPGPNWDGVFIFTTK